MPRAPGQDVLDEVNRLLRWAIESDARLEEEASKHAHVVSAEARRVADEAFDAARQAYLTEARTEIDVHVETRCVQLARGDRYKHGQYSSFISDGRRRGFGKAAKPRTTTIRACTVTTEQDIFLAQLGRARKLNKSGALRLCVQEALDRAGGEKPKAPAPVSTKPRMTPAPLRPEYAAKLAAEAAKAAKKADDPSDG